MYAHGRCRRRRFVHDHNADCGRPFGAHRTTSTTTHFENIDISVMVHRIWLAFSNKYIASSHTMPVAPIARLVLRCCPMCDGRQAAETMAQPSTVMPENRHRRSEFICVHIVYRYIWDYKFLPQEIKFIRLRLICNWARVKWAKLCFIFIRGSYF